MRADLGRRLSQGRRLRCGRKPVPVATLLASVNVRAA